MAALMKPELVTRSLIVVLAELSELLVAGADRARFRLNMHFGEVMEAQRLAAALKV